jgi:hypothetical protein
MWNPSSSLSPNARYTTPNLFQFSLTQETLITHEALSQTHSPSSVLNRKLNQPHESFQSLNRSILILNQLIKVSHEALSHCWSSRIDLSLSKLTNCFTHRIIPFSVQINESKPLMKPFLTLISFTEPSTTFSRICNVSMFHSFFLSIYEYLIYGYWF